MPDTNSQQTLDTNASEFRLNRFEAAWLAWRPGDPIPDWRQHLPATEEPCSSVRIFVLLQMDIQNRIKAKIPALLGEHYFAVPRLQREDAQLDDVQQVELIQWEYLQRLKNGERPRRAEYEAAFPRHSEALRAMKPRSSCRRCKKIVELDETLQTWVCPDCGAESSLLPAAPPFVADPTPRTEFDLRGYQLIEKLGGGGMGDVYRCCDPALGRDLAIKVMTAEYRGIDVAERRFLREARIAGSLQHPNIVPVHNLGRLSGGLLHYTMRLVRGTTFADILKEEAGKPERLPYLLSIFEKICQAVAYAHSKRVIHRDLKPLNVMVGRRFGEVQVMDWGLAKVLKPDDAAAEYEATTDAAGTRIPVEADTPVDLSRAGSGFGTPAYMPPEQALGEWDMVDERADVFALGSILCEILTTQPAYSGTDGDEVHRRAKRGDVTQALGCLQQCGADSALVALCRECLSLSRDDRPRDANVVADRVKTYQAEVQERLRQAELERVAAETRAREEQARSVVEQERAKEALARAAAEAERAREAQQRAKAERRAKRRTLALAALVLVLLAGVGGALWWRQQQIEKADMTVGNGLAQAELLAEQAWADPLQTDRYRQALEVARMAAQLADNASAAARQRAAELIARLEREKDAAIKDQQLLAALLDVRGPREGPKYQSVGKDMMMALTEPTADEQFTAAFRRWGLDVNSIPTSEAATLLQARPAPVVTEVIAALDEWASERRRQGQAKQQWQPLSDLATVLDSNPGSKQRELREIVVRGRLPLERALGILSTSLRPVPLSIELPLGQDRRRLVQLAQQTDPAAEPILGLLTLVRAVRAAGEEGRAEQLMRAAIAARPGEVVLHHTLGQLLGAQQPPRWAEAVECYRAARAVRSELGVSLARALLRSDRESEGLDLLAWLVRQTPTNPYLHLEMGYALADKGRLDEKITEYRQAIKLDSKYALAHSNLGSALVEKGQWDEAMAEFRQALALDPKFAPAHNNLGRTLVEKGQWDEAMAEFRLAIALDPKYAPAYDNLGAALSHKGRLDEAMAKYRQAIALDSKDAMAHSNFGATLSKKGRFDEAMAECRLAIVLDPKFAPAHSNLGRALDGKGRLDEAMVEYRQAIALDPKDATAHNNLGAALVKTGRLDEAMVEYRQAIALDPKYSSPHTGLGAVLRLQGRLDEAMAEHRQAIALDPKFALACYNLGNALSDKGRVDEAVAEYRRSIVFDPRYASAHFNLGLKLYAKGQLDEAEAEYRQTIALDPKHAKAHGNLGATLQRQGRFDEAVAYYKRHHELGSKQPGWRYPSAEWVQDAKRRAALARRLPFILTGEESPANPGDAVVLASMCQQPYKKHYAASARLYAEAFTLDSKLAADLNQQHRYNAACSAAVAAAGQGEDAHSLPDKSVAMFRRWALGWLRDDLRAYAKLAERTNPDVNKNIQIQMAHWRSDADLASVRDPQELDRLPDNERAAWQALWRDVDELAKRLGEHDKIGEKREKRQETNQLKTGSRK
ncbi:MAG TPA: tetratricopeptide repeat protein [Gemmataceae bacterium]|nr:tetratricopeptide repeat protein [Gemmataceae bacterium]